jgi:hypothetical protein
MQVLDSFNSPILGFEGDVPILAIPLSTRSLSGEPAGDSTAGASAGSLRTRAGKCKASTPHLSRKRLRRSWARNLGASKSMILRPNPLPPQHLQRAVRANSPCADPTSKFDSSRYWPELPYKGSTMGWQITSSG